MPNGGITPDCLHCKFNQGNPFKDKDGKLGEQYCSYHKMQLASPVYVFCSHVSDAEFDSDPSNDEWIDKMLGERAQYRDDMMYLWLGGHDKPFFHVPLAPIPDYWHWTRERFFEELLELKEQYKDREDDGPKTT